MDFIEHIDKKSILFRAFLIIGAVVVIAGLFYVFFDNLLIVNEVALKEFLNNIRKNSPSQFKIDDFIELYKRFFLVVYYVIFIIIAGLLFEIGRQKNKRRLIIDEKEMLTRQHQGQLQELQSTDIFHTLDDEKETFEQYTKGAKRVSILARTGVNILSQYSRIFENLGKNNCEIRLLLLDKNSAASRYVYGQNKQIFIKNYEKTIWHYKEIKKNIKDNISLKFINPAPTLSTVIVEKDNGEDFISVQLYFIHSCIGRDRPLFRVYKKSKWFKVFLEEFEHLWRTHEEYKAHN